MADFGVAVGTPITFRYSAPGSSGTVVVPAGPAPGGYCKVVGTFLTGHFTTTEHIPSGNKVIAITTSLRSGRKDLTLGTFTGTLVTGINEVSYTDQDVPPGHHLGYVEICKTISGSDTNAPSSFVFVVNGTDVTVPTGACSAPQEVLAGSVAVSEIPTTGWQMASCKAIPTSALTSCQPSESSATVSVAAGSVTNSTVLSVTNTPAPIPATQVVSDGQGYCAVLINTHVVCWGTNYYAELGVGTVDGYAGTPVPVLNTTGSGQLSDVRSLTSYGVGFCAIIATDGSVDCWGDEFWGEAGTGNGVGQQPVPTEVWGLTGSSSHLTGVVQLASDPGTSTNCALLNSGAVDCWGGNNLGWVGDGTESGPQLCDGFNHCATYPSFTGITNATSLASSQTNVDGPAAFCAILASTEVKCWGGDVGDVPRFITVSPSGNLSGVQSIASSGWSQYCAVLYSTIVDCWNASGTVASPLPGVGGIGTLSGVAMVVTGNGVQGESFQSDSSCALLLAGGVDCWGDNTYGELGVGPTPTSSVDPVQVLGVGGVGLLGNVVQLSSSGAQDYCAVLSGNGAVDCWGYDGEIEAYTSPYPSNLPVVIPSTTGSGQLSGIADVPNWSFQSICALTTSGGVDCWGNGGFGALGSSSFGFPPTPVVGLG